MSKVNDFSISVATVNGSGSQSANNILMRSIFRMGIPVEGKNLFPSNIAGLPTWFSIRVNDEGFTSRKKFADIFVAMNDNTLEEDLAKVTPEGLFIYNKTRKTDESLFQGQAQYLGIPFGDLASQVTKSIQLKKLLTNMTYVGVLAELLGIPEDVLEQTIQFQFKGKESVYKVNQDAVNAGRAYVREELSSLKVPYALEKREATKGKILIDGNSAAALGMVFGGCTFTSWYPITPSSSLAENFENYCERFRIGKNGEKNFAVVQAEDELSAISMVAGAGWAGARAMTTTSGPGVSLMNEAVGLMYFAEIPGVIWDVQRMGPSTGLPTRTSQGDIALCAQASHGDTNHPVLIPSTVEECFEFAGEALELADKLQTPVFVLSDLDLGMNFWMSDTFDYPSNNYDRGKVLNADQLNKTKDFARYKDVDGDGVPYRTLPGTPHDLAAYFTRGTGHTPEARYSEDADNYRELLDRFEKKWETAATLVPKPYSEYNEGADIGIIYYGSTRAVVDELLDRLSGEGKSYSTLCIKAYPFNEDVKEFIEKHPALIVLEQNHHGQMKGLLQKRYPGEANKMTSVLVYDGLPVSVEDVSDRIAKVEINV